MHLRFFVAPFSCAGEQQEIGEWSLDALSDQWLEVCARFLESHGDVFDATWPEELSHIRTRLTSDSGAALVDISIHGQPALTAVFLRGEHPDVESDVIDMFVMSMKRGVPQGCSDGFDKAGEIGARPLMLVVPHVNENIADMDHDVVRELSLHLAASFLCR